MVVSLLGIALICIAASALHGRGVLTGNGLSTRTPIDAKATDSRQDRAVYDPEVVGKSIEFWKAQAARDPEGALERKELAAAYMARYRETGAIADAVAAEQAVRESRKILSRNHAFASTLLARSLVAQHRFAEALEEARRAEAFDPQAGRLVADIQIELGDYEAAGQTLAHSSGGPEDMNYLALRARLEQINGKPAVALEFLKNARSLADKRLDMPAEAVAWYHAMVGHALIDSGKLDEGEQACRNALEIFPRDYRAMTSLADAAAWRGNWNEAITWGEKAIAVSAQNPQARRVIGDAHAALDHPEEAARQYQLLKELAHSFPRIYDRHWAMFCADNGNDLDLDEALILARNDLELRRDIHAYDTLAWVCFKKNRLEEARSASALSLKMGTKEASLFYHAGMIARASGDLAKAKDCFTRAREIRPNSVPLRWIQWLESKEKRS